MTIASPAAASTFSVTDPATGATLGHVAEQSPAEVAAAVHRGRAAQPAWAALPFEVRARTLRRLSSLLAGDEALVNTLVAEGGKPRFEALAFEIFYTCELTRYLTGRAGRRALADQRRSPFVFAHKRTRVLHHPRGVVGVIGPWNWPLLNNYADAVAPLLAGNAVVLKPSPLTPLTSLRVAELARLAGIPDDVFQVVTGGGPVGEALVAAVDMVFFTGSVAVGRSVARAAADRLIPAVLELGGKSPMLVMADADLDAAADSAVWSAFANSGQTCVRTERVLVESSVADAFTDRCVARVRRLRQGLPGDAAEIDVGAMRTPAAADRIGQQLEDAVAKGARVLVGGRLRTDLGPGCFFEPTVVAGVTPDMAIAREETFGPVLVIAAVHDEAEALRLANDSRFGLAGSVFARPKRAGAIARRMETGSVCVNDSLVHYFCVESPLGGIKQSGLGVRHGPEALRQFCWVETIVEDRPLLGRIGAWLQRHTRFPYRSRNLGVIRWLMARLYNPRRPQG